MKARGKSNRRVHIDPTVRADVNDERCPDCGASYQAFRSGETYASVHGQLTAMSRAVADERAQIRDADKRVHIGEGAVLGYMATLKRAMWAEQHGPGRCVFGPDEYIATFRANMTGVVVLDDREWRLREIVADLLLDDDDTANEESIEAETGFNVDEWDAVPVFIDDGNATTCIAA